MLKTPKCNTTSYNFLWSLVYQIARSQIIHRMIQFLQRGKLKRCRDCFECPFWFIVFLVKTEAVSDGV